MSSFHFKKLLQKDGWKSNVTVTIDRNGIITSLIEGQDDAPRFKQIAVPGFQNAHSHAFQYAMAGLAEVHDINVNKGDFWTWRESMYELALQIDPDDLESIAAMLYTEMVSMGYSNVAEFHYVHHDKKGKSYANLAEMGERLVAAANKAGINITLIPIFYQKGGFGMQPNPHQKRFISKDFDTYLELLNASETVCKSQTHANIGIGIHSMRGVEPEIIKTAAEQGPQDIPFHIHIAEQLKEIEDCISYTGKRPVDWFLENISLNDRFHLVHATHLNEREIQGIASSGANVVICPTTEGNLGDGIFPLRKYQELGGKWSIGTDSHIGINPLEELRLLDYGQRLITHKRDTFIGDHGDSGRFAIEMATIAGRKAMNNFSDKFFEVGKPLNVCLMSDDTPLLLNTSDRNLASSILYTGDSTIFNESIINGKIVMKEGWHLNYDQIRSDFERTLSKLKNR